MQSSLRNEKDEMASGSNTTFRWQHWTELIPSQITEFNSIFNRVCLQHLPFHIFLCQTLIWIVYVGSVAREEEYSNPIIPPPPENCLNHKLQISKSIFSPDATARCVLSSRTTDKTRFIHHKKSISGSTKIFIPKIMGILFGLFSTF